MLLDPKAFGKASGIFAVIGVYINIIVTKLPTTLADLKTCPAIVVFFIISFGFFVFGLFSYLVSFFSTWLFATLYNRFAKQNLEKSEKEKDL
ncbi:MAG: hypothetical protein ABIA74_00755 [bacterium]